MFKIGEKVCLNLKNLQFKTIILNKKQKSRNIFYQIDWSLFHYNILLNQVWITEKSLSSDLQ